MKRLLMVSAILIIVVGLVYAQAQPGKPTPVTSPRYQLVPATAPELMGNGIYRDAPQVFLVDTVSGHVWMYRSATAEKKAPDGSVSQMQFPTYFTEIPVGFDSPLMERQLRMLDNLKQSQK